MNDAFKFLPCSACGRVGPHQCGTSGAASVTALGCGTTGVACMNTGRRFIGIEMDASYFQAAQGRIMEAEATATPAAAK